MSPDFERMAAHSVTAASYMYDRIDAHAPRLLVPHEARQLKAALVIRTAWEMNDPLNYVPDMARFVADVNSLAVWYSVTPLKVSEVVRVLAQGLVDAWQREAVVL